MMTFESKYCRALRLYRLAWVNSVLCAGVLCFSISLGAQVGLVADIGVNHLGYSDLNGIQIASGFVVPVSKSGMISARLSLKYALGKRGFEYTQDQLYTLSVFHDQKYCGGPDGPFCLLDGTLPPPLHNFRFKPERTIESSIELRYEHLLYSGRKTAIYGMGGIALSWIDRKYFYSIDNGTLIAALIGTFDDFNLIHVYHHRYSDIGPSFGLRYYFKAGRTAAFGIYTDYGYHIFTGKSSFSAGASARFILEKEKGK